MRLGNDFRSIMKSELEERMSRNPKYSLRAFARDLEVSPARLSEILNAKKGLSRDAAIELSERMGMNITEQNMFCDLVEAQCARSATARKLAQARITEKQTESQKQQVLSMDAFKLVSEWYHFAILALMDLPEYLEDADWVAKQLGIRAHQVKEAMERMKRLGLTIERDGRTYPAQDNVLSPDGIPSDAIRKAHEQLLGKAIEALYSQAVGQRDYFSYMLPISGRDIPELRNRIRVFLNEVRNDFSTRAQLDRVICLSNQFYSLSRGDHS